MELECLMDVQQTLCLSSSFTQKSALITRSNLLITLVEEIKEDLENIQKIIFFKYNDLQKLKFGVENIFDIGGKVNIDNKKEELRTVDISNVLENPSFGNNTGVLHDELSKLLPSKTVLRRSLLKPGDMVYASKLSLLQPWSEAAVKYAISNTYFQVAFSKEGEKTDLSYIHIKHLAYLEPSKIEYPIGTRVIAKLKHENIKMRNNFYAGIIAELPIEYNNYRYLIFFDGEYTQYVCHENIRLVCHQSTDVSDDVDENVKEFIKTYLGKYPVLPMVQFIINQSVRTKMYEKWYLAKVINLDASLVELKINEFSYGHIELMYRGSNRLHPIYNYITKSQKKQIFYSLANINKMLNQPYIEFEYFTENKVNIHGNHQKYKSDSNVVLTDDKSNSPDFYIIELINIPIYYPKPIPYLKHNCNHLCRFWIKYDVNKTKCINALSIPLYFGFERLDFIDKNSKLKTIKYITPCGLQIMNEKEMYDYLKTTSYAGDKITINLFSFDHSVNPLTMFKVTRYFKFIHDISNDMEFKPISAVNSLNYSKPPDMVYTIECIPRPNVNMNLNFKFECSCDCTDNCDDKTKCSCWKLTYKSRNKLPGTFKSLNPGYRYKRLHEQLLTGIYECNKNCKCLKTCSNRVVQEPLSTSLQLFLSERKGWCVRTLVDIPKGAFVCKFVGEIYTENDAGKNGDECLANLNFIKEVEKFKANCETDVENSSETESESSSFSEEESKPDKYVGDIVRSVGNNSKIDGKHLPSTLDMQQLVYEQNKSFLDKDCTTAYVLDAKTLGNVGRYLSHSPEPNLFIQGVFIDTHDQRFPSVAFFASKNISAGTELCWHRLL